MKIAVDLTKAKNSYEGITQVAKHLLARLDGISLHGGAYLTLRQKPKVWRQFYQTHFPAVKVRCRKVWLPNRYFNWPGWPLSYRRLLGAADAYVFFYNTLPPRFRAANIVTFMHDLTELKQAPNARVRQQIYRRYQTTVARSRLLITDSAVSRAEIVQTFPAARGKIEVLYCGVDSARLAIPTTAAQQQQVRAQYQLPAHYLLFVGQPRENKNLPRLLRAYAALPAALKAEYGLVIANTNPQLDALHAELQLGAPVRLLHGIAAADLVSVYQAASALVLVSTSEGFGLPMIEAMAAGVPVLAAQASCLPEIAGDAALLVDPYQVDSITAGLARILTDNALREKLIKAGHARAQFFTWERAAAQFRAYLTAYLTPGGDT